MVIERNNLLEKMFQHFLGDKVRIYGNSNNPKIINKNKWELSCYVKNFEVYFAKDTDKNKVMFKHKMTSNNPDNFPDAKMFHDWLDKSDRREVFTIKITNTSLFLNSYGKYLDIPTGEQISYPIFAEYQPRIAYSRAYAEGIIKQIQQRGAPISVSLEIF